MRDVWETSNETHDYTGCKQMIIANYLPENRTYHFQNIVEASRKTHITERRIYERIMCGGRWRGWTFDLEIVKTS